MRFLSESLQLYHAGRILDLATGEGEFLGELLESIAGYETAVGIDLDEERLIEARSAVTDPRVTFEVRDALATGFDNNSFDTVAVRNSLHHVDQPERLLAELHRVLKLGGLGVIVECVRDSGTDQQGLYVAMHHWWGAIHRAKGITHNATLPQDELLALIDNVGFTSTERETKDEPDHDPMDPKRIRAIDEIMAEHLAELEKGEGIESGTETTALINEGNELRRRLTEIGISAPRQMTILVRK